MNVAQTNKPHSCDNCLLINTHYLTYFNGLTYVYNNSQFYKN